MIWGILTVGIRYQLLQGSGPRRYQPCPQRGTPNKESWVAFREKRVGNSWCIFKHRVRAHLRWGQDAGYTLLATCPLPKSAVSWLDPHSWSRAQLCVKKWDITRQNHVKVVQLHSGTIWPHNFQPLVVNHSQTPEYEGLGSAPLPAEQREPSVPPKEGKGYNNIQVAWPQEHLLSVSWSLQPNLPSNQSYPNHLPQSSIQQNFGSFSRCLNWLVLCERIFSDDYSI